MKIAILIPGHLRAWEYCRQNFIENLYDNLYDIDVYIETYNEIFRSDYVLHGEHNMKIYKSNEEIINMFHGINVVYFGIESEKTGPAPQMQARKITKLHHNIDYFKYDIIVRHRFDILLDNKINYKKIYNLCNNKIFIGSGAINMKENDMFAIGNSNAMKIYMNRFELYPHKNDQMIPHNSMNYIKDLYGIEYDQSIGMSIVRLDGKGGYQIEK